MAHMRPGGAANGVLFTSVLLDLLTTLHLQVASKDGCEHELEVRSRGSILASVPDVMGLGHLCPQVRKEPRASTSKDLRGCEHCFQQTRTLMDREIWGESLQLYALEVAFLHSICIINPSEVKRGQTYLLLCWTGPTFLPNHIQFTPLQMAPFAEGPPPPFRGSTSNTSKCKQSSCFLKVSTFVCPMILLTDVRVYTLL